MTTDFTAAWNQKAVDIHTNAVDKGFWDEERNTGEMIALVHSELSEGLEAVREGNPPDDKIPTYTGLEAELADAVIRIMDMAIGLGLDVGGAIEAKTAYNATRERLHGKQF